MPTRHHRFGKYVLSLSTVLIIFFHLKALFVQATFTWKEQEWASGRVFFSSNLCLEKNIFQYSRKTVSVCAIINLPRSPKLMLQYLLDVANVRALFIILKDQKAIHLFLNMVIFKGRCLQKFTHMCRKILLKQNPKRMIM